MTRRCAGAGTATPICSAPTSAFRWRPTAATRRPRRSRRNTWRCWRGWAWRIGVLVHPSAYGDDYSLLLDALAAQPDAARRDRRAARQRLPRWPACATQGVRGARFSHRSGAGANFAGSASFDDLLALAPRLADAGLHAELWTDCQALPDIADAAARAAGAGGDRPHGRLRR